MKPTTILHLIETWDPGGAEKMLISLVTSLDTTHYRSVICLLKDGWLNRQLRHRGFDTVILPQRKGLDPGWIYQCMRLIRQKKVDLLHAHEFAMNFYGCIAARIMGIPIITTVHGKGYYADKWRRRFAYRFVSRNSLRMVAVSEDVRHFLITEVGASPDHLATIYNGIDPKPFTPSEEVAGIRKELGIEGTALVIGTIGSLYPVKGHGYLLNAAARVASVLPGAIFLIAGRGELLNPLQEEAGKLGIIKNVRFLGFREDIQAILQAMDLFVLPSLSEGLSLSLLEAMAAGKPVVATNVGGNPEVVLHGITGYLVPPKDPESLALRVVELLKDRSLAQQFGANGQRRVYERFRIEQMVKSYQELYKEALMKRKVII